MKMKMKERNEPEASVIDAREQWEVKPRDPQVEKRVEALQFVAGALACVRHAVVILLRREYTLEKYSLGNVLHIDKRLINK
jgi:hypothetical protein